MTGRGVDESVHSQAPHFREHLAALTRLQLPTHSSICNVSGLPPRVASTAPDPLAKVAWQEPGILREPPLIGRVMPGILFRSM